MVARNASGRLKTNDFSINCVVTRVRRECENAGIGLWNWNDGPTTAAAGTRGGSKNRSTVRSLSNLFCAARAHTSA
jgi:hypothetical protein